MEEKKPNKEETKKEDIKAEYNDNEDHRPEYKKKRNTIKKEREK